MSADNYHIVRKHPKGGFTPVMGFASDQIVDGEWRDDIHPEAQASDPQFDTPERALESVIYDYAEYGHDIHDECEEELTSTRAIGELNHGILAALAGGSNVGHPALRNHWNVEGLGYVTRVEVIDETGRAYVRHGVKVTVQAQDHGGTLKVFVGEREEEGA